GTDLIQEVHEFMRAEGIGFGRLAPGGIEPARSLVGGANAVTPMVAIREAAARPANDRNLDTAQRGDHVGPDAPHVGNGGIGSNPDALINATPKMFDELAINVGIDRWAIGAYRNSRFGMQRLRPIASVIGLSDGRNQDTGRSQSRGYPACPATE